MTSIGGRNGNACWWRRVRLCQMGTRGQLRSVVVGDDIVYEQQGNCSNGYDRDMWGMERERESKL